MGGKKRKKNVAIRERNGRNFVAENQRCDILIHWTFLGVHDRPSYEDKDRETRRSGRARTRSRPRMHENHQEWKDDDR